MLIQRSQRIAGWEAVEVREVMRTLQRAPHSTRALALRLGITEEAAVAFVTVLRSEALVEAVVVSGPYAALDDEYGPRRRAVLWGTTIGGNALAKARIGSPMARSKAEELVDALLVRVAAVNDAGSWLHRVREVVLYGSLALPGDGQVGDVDIAVRLEPRYHSDDYFRLQEEMVERDGAHPRSLMEATTYAQVKLLRYLRGGSSRVDLVEIDDARPLPPDATAVVLYRHIPTG